MLGLVGCELTRASVCPSVFWCWSLSRLWASSDCSEVPDMSESWRRDSSSSSETHLCSLCSALSASPASDRARSNCVRTGRGEGGQTSEGGQPGAPAAGIP